MGASLPFRTGERQAGLFLSQANIYEAGRVFDPAHYYTSARVAPADDTLKEQVRREAGWRDVGLPP